MKKLTAMNKCTPQFLCAYESLFNTTINSKLLSVILILNSRWFIFKDQLFEVQDYSISRGRVDINITVGVIRILSWKPRTRNGRFGMIS